MLTPRIHITQTGTEPVIISLSGGRDLATGPELHIAVRRAIAAGSGVVVDLSRATFIDSAILRTLVDAHRAAAATGAARIAVVAPPASTAAQLFDLVHASNVLAIFPSLDAAVERYPGRSRGMGRCAFPKCPAAGFVKENDLALCPPHRELLLSDPGEFRRLWGAIDPRPVATPRRDAGRPEAPVRPAAGSDRT